MGRKTSSNGSSHKKLGYAEIGAFAGIQDGGKAVVEGPTVSVNRPLTAPNLKHQSRIFGKRFVVTEEEDMNAVRDGDRMVSYKKEVNGEQSDMEGKTPEGEEIVGPSTSAEGETPEGLLPRAEHFLKNMIDKLSDRVGINTAAIIAVGIIAALALGMAIAQ